MNHSAILVVARSYALARLSDNTAFIPLPVANFYALPWSRRVYDFFTERHPCWCCVWLFAGAARPEILGEFAGLGIPLTLITKEDTAQIYRATNLMAQYPNICGIVFEPFDNTQCEYLMAKMRNAATARRFWNALESTLFPSKPETTEIEGIPLPTHDRVIYAEVNDHYTDIFCTNREKHVSLQSLSAVVCDYGTQTPFGATPPLIRIHNKYAVNPAQVLAVRPTESKRDYILTLSTGKELPVSRSYKHNLTHLPVKAKRSQGGG